MTASAESASMSASMIDRVDRAGYEALRNSTKKPGPSGKTPAAGGHPVRRANLRTGSDVLRLCESVRAHEMAGADAMREKAQEVYRGVIKSSNWPFGINKRVAAVRMRRSLRKVANAMELSARSAAAARKTWTDVVTGSGAKRGKPSGFDATR